MDCKGDNPHATNGTTMVFSSPLFLFLFLPLTLGLYFTSPHPLRNSLLLVASLLFYAWGEPAFVLVMLGSILINWAFGLAVDKTRERKLGLWILGLSVAVNLALIAHYKYAAFLVENLNVVLAWLDLSPLEPKHRPLPLGISFFTFQALSYVVDVYRREGKAQKNPLNVALYIALFPQLIAGPIVRFCDVAEQIAYRVVTREGFAYGIERFVMGLAKKVLIANTCGAVADEIFSVPGEQLSAGVAWLGLVCYALQIYFDFSGYSCMAIGLGSMFGFKFLENFNYPYVARSITEFWRRWHMSLSTWFRDYLYVPLGGNRVAPWRVYLNLMLVFFLCGLWHGASWNFVIWGLMHGGLLIVERLGWRDWISRRSPAVAHTYVVLAVLLAWVPFRIETLEQSMAFYRALFGLTTGSAAYHVGLYLRPGLILALVAGVIGSMPFVPWLRARVQSLTQGATPEIPTIRGGVAALAGVAVVGLLLAACMIELSASTYNPFIYFRF